MEYTNVVSGLSRICCVGDDGPRFLNRGLVQCFLASKDSTPRTATSKLLAGQDAASAYVCEKFEWIDSIEANANITIGSITDGCGLSESEMTIVSRPTNGWSIEISDARGCRF